jgi:hypothetical protein
VEELLLRMVIIFPKLFIFAPDVGVLQASPRQHHGSNLPPRDHILY